MNNQHERTISWRLRTLAAATAAVLTISTAVLAQQPNPAPNHQTHNHPATGPSSNSVANEVQDLRAKVARLEAALQNAHLPGTGTAGAGAGSMGAMSGPSGSAGGGMKMMDEMMPMGGGGGKGMGSMSGGAAGGAMSGGSGMPAGGSMKMMDDDMPMSGGAAMAGNSGSMSGGGMGGAAMSPGMMKMSGMMGMAPAAGMSARSALPGFPGASHLYHVGSTDFFLDHGDHVNFTVEQRTALNAVKEKALMAQAARQRDIEAGEQELWTLTASDQPDSAKIEAKVREVERARSDQRLEFIRSVGEAAKVLTDEQGKSLLGQMPPQMPQPAASGGMADM